MPSSEFFAQYGLLAVKDIFDRDFCSRICSEIQAESHIPGAALRGAVLKHGTKDRVVDEEIRRTKMFILASPNAARVREKLIELMPQVAKHFSIELSGCQTVKFAVYRTGDFFKLHVDTVDSENVSQEVKERKVSVVIFLNQETTVPQENSYCGGQLTFHGLMKDSVFGNLGLPLSSKPGLFIAFSPKIQHEVTPITNGERYVIITWYK